MVIKYLVETILTTVTDIDDLDDLCRQPRVEHVAQTELRLEVRATREHEASHVDLVVRDEVLHGQLGDLADVVVPLLVTQTRETERGLSTTAVLLREVNGELVDHLAGVARDGTEERAVSVHDDEPELGVGLEQLLERFGVELIVTEVERSNAICEQADKTNGRATYVFIGLCGSKSNDTFFSFPSSVKIVPTKSTRPFGGTRLYSLRRCWVLVMAASTDSLFTRDLMLEAVPYSCVSIADIREI